MRHDHLQRELDLLLLMTENRSHTVAELCERLSVSQRSLYYYLDFFREAGFTLVKSGSCYRLSRHSPFFRRLHRSIDFTEEEAVLLRRLTDGAPRGQPLVESIRRKLEKFYDLRILTDVAYRERVSRCVSRLYEAIKYRQTALLRGYSSPHSHTVSDRVVEPFLFLPGNGDVRCYEPRSGQNKTFKVSRMQDVEVLDLLWSHESEHREVYTDIFRFSGEERHPVRLLLGQLAANLIGEEWPEALACLTPQPDGRSLLATDVCSYAGVGRFVLGLYDDIEVLGDDGLRRYLRERIGRMWEGGAAKAGPG